MAEGLKKDRQIRIYFSGEAESLLDESLKALPMLKDTELLRILTREALMALKKNNFQLPFPFHFQVVPGPSPIYAQKENRAAILNDKKR